MFSFAGGVGGMVMVVAEGEMLDKTIFPSNNNNNNNNKK